MNSEEIKTGVIRPVECFKEGWQLIKNDYWLLFAITIVGVVIGGVTLYIAVGAIICGIFKCYLRVIDGGNAEFENLFSNFKQYFGAGLFVMAVIIVPMILVFSLITIPTLIEMTAPQRMSGDEILRWYIGTLIIEFVIAFVMVCLHTLLMFAFPLIVDRHLTGWQAIKTSARAVWRNLNDVAGLWAVGFGVGLIGYFMLCIGIYFTIPIIIAGNTVAYRKIFPAKDSLNTHLSSPDAV
jgi:hypothetical protein